MAEVKIKLKPWMTPNHAILEGYEKSVPLRELDDDAFHALIVEWLSSVYDKAGQRKNYRFE